MLDFALLGFLNYRPMTGYELKQYMDGSTSHFWNAKLSQIYTTLKSLEEKGWVRSSVQAQEERPDKRIYTITSEGKSSLRKWLAEPLTELTSHKNALLLKLFFAASVFATEEAILNSMVAAEEMTGHNGFSVKALPHEELRKIMKKYNRMQ
jgi:DNA-binding PadR family transcriptional regulator